MRIVELNEPGAVTPAARRELVECWTAVSEAGGAVGFAPPVRAHAVEAAADELIARLHPERTRLLVSRVDGSLAGWVAVEGNSGALAAHWGTVRRLQVHPRVQQGGIGTALMHRVREVAAAMGLEQLHLTARGGMGLEGFYERLGWREIGRWPRALRIGPGDDRDEVLMFLDLRG